MIIKRLRGVSLGTRPEGLLGSCARASMGRCSQAVRENSARQHRDAFQNRFAMSAQRQFCAFA